MKQESEIRNGIVSACEARVSNADRLEADRALHIVHGGRDRFQFFHAVHNCVGILQAVPGDSANNPTLFRNLSERIGRLL